MEARVMEANVSAQRRPTRKILRAIETAKRLCLSVRVHVILDGTALIKLTCAEVTSEVFNAVMKASDVMLDVGGADGFMTIGADLFTIKGRRNFQYF